LRALIGRVDSWEGLGQKLSFGRKLAEAGKQAELATSAVANELAAADHEVPPEDADRFTALAKDAADNPSYSITAAWDELQRAMAELVSSASVDLDALDMRVHLKTGAAALAAIRRIGYVDDSFVEAVNGLRQLRNKVAHGQHKPTPDEAVSYVASARELARASQVLANLAAQRAIRVAPPVA
jgi:hypothetical protein